MKLQLVIILVAAALRVLPHEPNVAPIGALALFGGAYLPKKWALIVPLMVMFISDLVLGFHSTMGWVYGSFLLIGLIGLWLRKQKDWSSILLASLVGSFSFYLITNFGVWFSTDMYPKTIAGLFQSYLMAIPFLRNTLLGDLFYNGLFFGSFQLATNYLKSRATHTL